MAMLHLKVIADMETCGTDAKCQQWVAKCRSCADEVQNVSFEHWVIPRLPLDDAHFMGAVRDAYEVIAEKLGHAIESASSADRFVAILDARLAETIEQISSLQSVQGLLILSFPDVLWVPVFSGKETETEFSVKRALDLVMAGFNPLFDGTGLRGALIRKRETNSAYHYDRKDVAVTIDEERHFAELNAYTAFRFGYRAIPVSTERLARQVLGVDKKEDIPSLAGGSVEPDASLVVFEDGDVEFPDCTQAKNKMHQVGDRRGNAWPLLKDANLRVLATAFRPEEKIANGGAFTAGEWFRKANVKELGGGKRKAVRAAAAKASRQVFNLCAGGMGDVWVWNLCKGGVIVGALVGILICCPVLFIPALLLAFAAFGLFRNAIVKMLGRLFGHRSRIRTFFNIRAQWRFYPKLYANHFPQWQIHGKGARYWCFVRKPLGGIFGLRNQCGLPNGRNFDGPLSEKKVRSIFKNASRGRAPTETGETVKDATHSAYGMTLDIATDLIGRARTMKNRGGGIEDAIHAAVLATCAYELLGHKTPALSIEALGLRHYCEVMAECEFPGVRARLDMEDRLVDIHNSMWQICRSSDGAVREDMFANGMAAICDSLANLLRSRGRYSEATFMTRRARYMHRLLLPPFWRNLLAYPEWVLRSPWHFSISFLMVAVVFGWLLMGDLQCAFSRAFAHTLNALVFNDSDIKAGSVIGHAIQQIAVLHLAFLGITFWDAMQRK